MPPVATATGSHASTGRDAVTRLAPSPTGALHLGNARTFLINWMIARANGWRVVLRIEDLDGPRVRAGAEQQAIDDLRWLGIDWDAQSPRQSMRRSAYDAEVERLLRDGHAYPCVCTRREVELAASAPHAEDGSAVYPGTCRGRFTDVAAAEQAAGRTPAVRFRVDDKSIEFTDGFAGVRRFDPLRELGDFVIRKSDGMAAYQLAVVVDDVEAGVTQVVRGDDLIDSTPRQMMLYAALGWGDRIPHYTHLPLVVGTDGRRLAKRHGDTRLASYRAAGVPARRVLALLARWCGIDDVGDAPAAHDLIGRFSLDRLPRQPITFSPDQHAFLIAGAVA